MRLARSATGRWGRMSVGTVLAFVWVVIVVVLAMTADVLPLARYDGAVRGLRPRLGPRWAWPEPLGTDLFGRSVLSRLVYGARQSLAIGAGATVASMSLGIVLGMIAGYVRGFVDRVISIVFDAILSVPGIVLLLAASSIGRRDAATVVVGLALVGMPVFGRLARAHTLRIETLEHIQATRSMGATHVRILGREILPDVLLPTSTFGFVFLGLTIVVEGTLSFLGYGVPPPSPSWGGMINDGRPLLSTAPAQVFLPALCLLLTVSSFTCIGDFARRRFDRREAKL